MAAFVPRFVMFFENFSFFLLMSAALGIVDFYFFIVFLEKEIVKYFVFL